MKTISTNEAFIYALICPIKNEIRYIGQTYNIKNRLKSHISTSIKNNKTHKETWILSLKQKNLKPIIEIIDIVDKSVLDFWEMHYISLYKSWGFNLLNLTMGGQQNRIISMETRLKISNTLKGNKLSEETRKKISISNKIAWQSEELKEVQRKKRKGKTNIELFGKEIALVISKKLRKYGLTRKSSDSVNSKISETLKSKYSTGDIINPNKIKVVQLNLKTLELIKIWDCIADAKKGLNIKSCISYVCNGKRKHALGFKWMYYDEYIKINNNKDEDNIN